MTFEQLFAGISYEGTLPLGEVQLVTQDSRRVAAGAVFVCIAGRGFDGHDFAQRALQAGAGLVVSQHPPAHAQQVCVENTRAAYAQLCANYFGHPAEKLVLAAVTGTNGKTTVSSVLKQVLEQNGKTCGLIGTIHSEIGNMRIPAKFTTPDPWDLNALLARMYTAGCSHVVMEASSQALEQGRLLGVPYKLGIFSNLSRDHLDYHGDMENYFAAKRLLFAQCEHMLVNCDDEFGRRMLQDEKITAEKHSFSSTGAAADFSAQDVRLKADGVRFALLGAGFLLPVIFPMPGEYSVSNALAVAGGAILLGCEPDAVASSLAGVRGVMGRCEVIYSKEFTVIRDFAHTADGIEQLLRALRPFVEKRLVVLYGCTGDRDAEKRRPMGQAAARYADMIYLTSDNPRTEDPQSIIEDAVVPLKESGKPFETQPDRTMAIHRALEQMQQGDMLVLCGKGHEDYQVMDGVTHYLDESQIVKEWLA